MPVTSREIMEMCEIKNVKTLTRWYQAGLIPEPNVQKHPGGAGRIAVWPEWVLNHCRAIKQLTAKGQTIEQIKETFGSEWETIAHRYQRYNFLEVSQKMDFDNAVWSVQEVIDDVLVKFLGDARESILAVKEPLIAREIVIQGLDLMRQSYNPVLILAFERIVVVPDFVVSHYLAENFHVTQPFLVVPLHAYLLQQFRTDVSQKKPRVRPAPYVERTKSGQLVEQVLQIQDRWEFRLGPVKKVSAGRGKRTRK